MDAALKQKRISNRRTAEDVQVLNNRCSDRTALGEDRVLRTVILKSFTNRSLWRRQWLALLD